MSVPLVRCPWAAREPELTYHDTEWGVPSHDDRHLFELLILEGAQAGLSWETILNKRAGYRAAYDGFDPALVATYDDGRLAKMVLDTRIVRHRGKIAASIGNASAFLAVQREFGSFDAYLWAFVAGHPIVNRPATDADVPATSPLSEQISRDLKRRGFRFVGPTTIYAFLQATGVVNDHRRTCFRASKAR